MQSRANAIAVILGGTGVEINFFNHLPVGQIIANVCLPEIISTCPKQIGTVNFDVV